MSICGLKGKFTRAAQGEKDLVGLSDINGCAGVAVYVCIVQNQLDLFTVRIHDDLSVGKLPGQPVTASQCVPDENIIGPKP